MSVAIPPAIGRLLSNSHRNSKVICCLPGTSQYTGNGVSSCALASLNAIRIVFELEGELSGLQLLARLVKPRTIRACLAICKSWKSDIHLDVDDVRRLPLFDATLSLCSKKSFGPAIQQTLLRCLSSLSKEVELRGNMRTAAMAITRPPEVLTVFCVPVARDSEPTTHLFAVFDSHPRPQHREGAAFVLLHNAVVASEYLAEVLAVDPTLFHDGSLQWQAELLSQFSAHCFMAKDNSTSPFDITTHAYDMNIAFMEHEQALQMNCERYSGATSYRETMLSRAAAGVDRMSRSPTPPRQHDVASHRSIPRSTYMDDESDRWSVHIGGSSASESISRSSSSLHRGDSVTAEFTDNASPVDLDDWELAIQLQLTDEGEDAAAQAAQAIQAAFDAEDARIRSERVELDNNGQTTFECAVCMDTCAEDDICRVDACQHTLCRPCMRNYIVSALGEKRYPILCPLCKAAASSKSIRDPTELPPGLVENIGLDQGQYQVWMALQLTGLSIEIECPKCKVKVHVDREDHDGILYLTCHSRTCRFVWCKHCAQEIPHGPVDHSCDGTKELDRLMKQKGWKHCPSCKTPCERSAGCNHMTCPIPGCNSHFCYRCGQLIIRSTVKREVDARIGVHYRICKLLDGF